jgi:hypothetical protein
VNATKRFQQKQAIDRAVKRSISLPQVLEDHGRDRARLHGFSTFSDYVQHLIRQDGFTKMGT